MTCNTHKLNEKSRLQKHSWSLCVCVNIYAINGNTPKLSDLGDRYNGIDLVSAFLFQIIYNKCLLILQLEKNTYILKKKKSLSRTIQRELQAKLGEGASPRSPQRTPQVTHLAHGAAGTSEAVSQCTQGRISTRNQRLLTHSHTYSIC